MINHQTVVRCLWQDTFGTLMDKFDGVYTIEKMLISSTEKFVDPVHIIPIQMLSLVYASSLNASMCASLLKVLSLMLAPWSEMHLM